MQTHHLTLPLPSSPPHSSKSLLIICLSLQPTVPSCTSCLVGAPSQDGPRLPWAGEEQSAASPRRPPRTQSGEENAHGNIQQNLQGTGINLVCPPRPQAGEQVSEAALHGQGQQEDCKGDVK